ncbi:hypothetical protein [Actinomadura craniellae]|uniref:hypothetical protein n=1 Tax=Actinomadura craniellae TaxID=2231787 RepID=UPI001314B63E|nr:hypothetical protein [Actinomadura craniellae]
MAKKQRIAPMEQDSILQNIGSALLGSAPNDWEEVHFRYNGLIDITTMSLEVTKMDGSQERLNPPDSAWQLTQDLRSGMYETRKGTWFSIHYIITRPARYSADFDYDNEPPFPFPVASGSFALDLQYFPRDDEHIPEWLRQKLEEAAAEGQ